MAMARKIKEKDKGSSRARKGAGTYVNITGTKDRGRDRVEQAKYDEFARRLQAQMTKRGWTQSELARRLENIMPTAKAGQLQNVYFGRDRISHYLNGRSLPRPESLALMARLFGVKEIDLLPLDVPLPAGHASPYAIEDIGGGRAAFNCNRTMSMKTALAISDLLRKEDGK